MVSELGPTRPRPRVLITGAGEPRVDELCAALGRRAIDAILIEGALDDAIRGERPNLVLLVGDAASDDGARAIDDARRAGSTPIVVATDPEPLDRRLAPFALGASGVLVRRGDPDEMAGEVQHLLAENARRIAESADERAPEELHGLLGMSAREILSRATPIEGVPRYEPIKPPSGSWGLEDVPTLEIPGVLPGQPLAAPLPDWDDLTTKRQPAPDVARWRRLSAADRGAMTTPPARAALDAQGTPRTPRAVSEDLDLIAAMEAETRPGIVAPPDHERMPTPEPAPPLRAARVSSVPPPRSSPAPARSSPPPPATRRAEGLLDLPAADQAAPVTLPETRAVASTSSEPISASVLIAPAPSRPPIGDRASTLRAQAMPRPRASAAPALVGIGVVMVAIALIAGPRAIEAVRAIAREMREQTTVHAAVLPAVGAEAAAVVQAPVAEAPAVVQGPAAVQAPAEAESPEQAVSDTTIPTSVDALVREARVLARRGDRAGARALLEQAVELDADDPHAAIALASHHLADRRSLEAVLFAERAVALRRRRPDYHVVLGDAYRLAGDDARARESWERALALDPEHPDARARLGP